MLFKRKIIIISSTLLIGIVTPLLLTSCARATHFFLPVYVGSSDKNPFVASFDDSIKLNRPDDNVFIDQQKNLYQTPIDSDNPAKTNTYDDSFSKNQLNNYLPSNYIFHRSDLNGYFDSYSFASPTKTNDLIQLSKNNQNVSDLTLGNYPSR
jgi:hypothetical protein